MRAKFATIIAVTWVGLMAGCSATMSSPDERVAEAEQAATACGAAWSQCGGQGWTGATCCVSGYICSAQNAYYSQCVPGSSSSSSASSSSAASSSRSSAAQLVNPSSAIVASVTVTAQNSQQISLQGKVTNNSSNPASNWQVAVNLNGTILQQGTNGAEVNMIGGQAVFSPTVNSSMLTPGSSATFTFTVQPTSGSTTPVVASVDGIAGSSAAIGGANDGVDHVARAVATGALNVAVAYENNKLANNGDANYGQYDGLLWAAQSYVINSTTGRIEFDPNMPGYAFIPNQAMAMLDAMQDNASVASYLVDGLRSCFADTKADYVYDFRAQVLKGYQNATTTSGAMGGTVPPIGAYQPSGYNTNNVVDNWTTVGMGPGGNVINVSETSTTAPASAQDMWFGLLTYTTLASFPNTGAVAAKFGTSGQTAACSPFNGPGGGANPYFTMKLNGQVIPARFTGVGAQCNNGCTSTMTLDPDAYAIPGPYYNTTGLVGPQPNPFSFDLGQTTSTPDHAAQYATTTDIYGHPVYGEFIAPVSHKGTITGYNWVQCGIGAGC